MKTWSDPHTFGTSKAAINLVKIFQESTTINTSWLANRVFGFLVKYNERVRDIAKMDSEFKHEFLIILKQEILRRCDEMNFPDLIDTHVRTIIATKHKSVLRKIRYKL